MDRELIEYLDRRFDEFRVEFRNDLRNDIRDEITVSATALRSEIAASAAETRNMLRSEIARSAAETRRHFDVVAERLTDTIQLLAEGVLGVDRKVDRLATEMRAEFQKIDRRFLHLEARVGRD